MQIAQHYTDLPTSLGFYLTYPCPKERSICTAAAMPLEEEVHRQAAIAERSDNATPLDLMTYAEIFEAVSSCLLDYFNALAPDWQAFQLSPCLLRIPDPHYIYSLGEALQDSDGARIPSAYFGYYGIEHLHHVPHLHYLPYLLTSYVPSPALIDRLFTNVGELNIAKHVGVTLETLTEFLGGDASGAPTPFSLFRPNLRSQ